MKKSLLDFYKSEKIRIAEKCIECGLCVKVCPIVEKTNLGKLSPIKIQKESIKFLKNGIQNEIAFTRAYSCMECFKCVENICPQGLDPMMLNELIKWEYKKNNYLEEECSDPKDKDSFQRIMANIQVKREDYERITSSSDKEKAKYVFFSGCNVYVQPEKLLNALDIMDLINEDFAFVPGLDYCCGDIYLFSGEIEKAEMAVNELVDKLSSYKPEKVICWCPTCQCRFYETISKIKEIPFEVISFPQFVAENMENLVFKDSINKRVTLHEPCKSAYLGVDLTGTRIILNKIPGVQLKEMPRHGKNTVCCGSGSLTYFPKSFKEVRDERLIEAAETNSQLLIDVCHYCHEVFVGEEEKYEYDIVNYVNLLAESIGIYREDKLKKYKKWKDIPKILEDAKEYIEESPYSREIIIEKLKKLI